MNGKTFFSEFKDIADNPENHTSDDLMELLYDLTKEKNLIKTLMDIQYHIEKDRLENDRCPKCNLKLKSIPYKEPHEYQGIEVVETLYTKKCVDCGEIYD